VREAHSIPDGTPLRQDDDVLDTWFSSALWTFSTLGWPEKNEDLAAFHPASVLVTGFDIIFFWVARMIMMSLHFMEEVPFHTVYVHGLVRDGEGQKMSKSKGNVLDPIDLIDGIELEALVQKRTSNLMQPQLAAKIEKATRKQFPKGITGYGTDALRYTFYSLASTGRDIKFDIGRMEGYRNFCNKIWNASRYVLSHTESHNLSAGDATFSLADRWIQSRLETTLVAVEDAYENYRFDLASQALYDFVWNEFCDWYLELSKPVLWDDATATSEQLGARRTLITVLEKSLRMLHPFMPFLTEEIWQTVGPLADQAGESIMLAPWPGRQNDLVDAESEAEIEWLKEIIVGIRTIRSESNIPPATELPVFVVNATELDRERFSRNEAYLGRLAKVSGITVLSGEEPPPASLMALCGDLEIRVPMAGVIDIEAELKRLDKEIYRQREEVAKLEGKLSNNAFTERAPADIVEAEKHKKEQAETALATLGRQRTQIEELRSA
jgi:valyl-tRNA synthetase